MLFERSFQSDHNQYARVDNSALWPKPPVPRGDHESLGVGIGLEALSPADFPPWAGRRRRISRATVHRGGRGRPAPCFNPERFSQPGSKLRGCIRSMDYSAVRADLSRRSHSTGDRAFGPLSRAGSRLARRTTRIRSGLRGVILHTAHDIWTNLVYNYRLNYNGAGRRYAG